MKTNSKMNALMITMVIIAMVAGCAALNQARFDEITYTRLTDLKPEVAHVYESFDEPTVDNDAIEEIELKLEQLLVHEKGKGIDRNAEMVSIVGRIITIYNDDVEARRKDGPWNQTNIDNSVRIIEIAFDQAIETENLKNRKK